MLDGLTDHATEVLKLPVPVTIDVHVEVWLLRIEIGEQVGATEVIVGGAGGALPPPPLQPVMAAKSADNNARPMRLRTMIEPPKTSPIPSDLRAFRQILPQSIREMGGSCYITFGGYRNGHAGTTLAGVSEDATWFSGDHF